MRWRRDELGAVVVEQRREDHFARLAVDSFEGAVEEAIAPAMAVAAIADFVEVGVERPGGDLVQQRLPDVGAVALDQDDVVPLATVARAELADEFEPAGAAADNYDLGLAGLPVHRCPDHITRQTHSLMLLA